MNKPKNYKSEFAKFVNINGEWKYYETEQDYIDLLNEEINQLKKRNKEIYDGYISATQELTEYAEKNERLNNIINTILDFNFFKEECPLNFGYQEECDEEKAQEVFYEDDYCEENCNDDYKKCWLKYFERLQELKEKYR